MSWNLIVDGVVVETFGSVPTLHPDLLVIEGAASVGDVWDGSVFSAPPAVTLSDADRIAEIKAAASNLILGRYPQWRQANMTARMLELVDIKAGGVGLSPAELTEETALKSAWQWVKDVRAASDAAELAGTLQANIVWPA